MYRKRYIVRVKKVIWHPKARATIKNFPRDAKRELGYLIFRLQHGVNLAFPHSRPISEVSPGVSELRVRGEDGIFRAFYFLKSEKGIPLFHAFRKKTPKTPSYEIKIGKKHLKELQNA